jgi:hypothetical protein
MAISDADQEFTCPRPKNVLHRRVCRPAWLLAATLGFVLSGTPSATSLAWAQETTPSAAVEPAEPETDPFPFLADHSRYALGCRVNRVGVVTGPGEVPAANGTGLVTCGGDRNPEGNAARVKAVAL